MDKDWPTPVAEEVKERIIARYAASPEGRSRLAEATFSPAQACMEAVTNDPTLVDSADRLASQMEQIQGYMTGEETYDKRKFASLLEGLKMLSEEIRGKKIVRHL
jgi:hypothetical protein